MLSSVETGWFAPSLFYNARVRCCVVLNVSMGRVEKDNVLALFEILLQRITGETVESHKGSVR